MLHSGGILPSLGPAGTQTASGRRLCPPDASSSWLTRTRCRRPQDPRGWIHLCMLSPACGAAACFAANRRMYELVIFNRYSSVASLLIFGNKDDRGGAPRRPSPGRGRRGAPPGARQNGGAHPPPRGSGAPGLCAVRHGPAVSGAAGGKTRPGRGPSGPGGAARVGLPQVVAGSPPEYRKGWAPVRA